MNTPAVRELLRPVMLVNSILWFALTASIFIYGITAYIVSQDRAPADVSDGLQLGLRIAAIITALLSLSVMRVFLSDDRLRKAMEPEASSEELAGQLNDEERLGKIQSLSPAERKLLRVPGLFFTPFIIRLVLNESIAIYGLVLVFLSHTFTPILPFAAAAIVLNFTCLPRIDAVLGRAARFC